MSAIKSIMEQISTLSLEEQRMVNKLLVASLNSQVKAKSADAAANFRFGQKVQFDAGPRKGGLITMEITGFSRDMTKIKGTQLDGFRKGCLWTVGANLCKAI